MHLNQASSYYPTLLQQLHIYAAKDIEQSKEGKHFQFNFFLNYPAVSVERRLLYL